MLNSQKNGTCSLIFTTPLVHTTTPTVSIKNCFSTSVNFHLPIPLLRVRKIIHTNPINTNFLLPQQFFTSPFLRTTIPAICTRNIFPTSVIQPIQTIQPIQFRIEGLVMTDTVWISPFSLKVRTVIMGLTTTDSLLLRLRKLVYCRQ